MWRSCQSVDSDLAILVKLSVYISYKLPGDIHAAGFKDHSWRSKVYMRVSKERSLVRYVSDLGFLAQC